MNAAQVENMMALLREIRDELRVIKEKYVGPSTSGPSSNDDA